MNITQQEEFELMATQQPINDGGTAFPHTTVNNMGGFVLQPGMTLRDWFAGMAMQGPLLSDKIWTSYEFAAREAYAMADAMIEARKGGRDD
jgi:hypothetical protein